MSVTENGITTQPDPESIYGGPTKRFFVSMLTRDIELNDAILDLVDNCVDGAIRQRKEQLNNAEPFIGFKATISLSSTEFRISDNCGGIPKDYIADAFSLGRPNIKKDGDLPTIGMYGIGMKRAIFKIGNSATVRSKSADGHFQVTYSADWLDPANDDWNLPITEIKMGTEDNGVEIFIDAVKAEIGDHFKNHSFVNRLKTELSEHFGYLMQKGFQIEVNGDTLQPKTLALFNVEHSEISEIRAYDYEATFDEVSIKVTVGLFRRLAKESEIDDETESPRDKDSAGISVICNDRVILVGDQTMKTGWGIGTVPRYHPQFRAIAGLIVFSSTNAEKLPISTTKRGLDVGSTVYLEAINAAMDGLKIFTSFTNKWKGIEDEASRYFEAVKRADVKTSIVLAKLSGAAVRGIENAKKYVPELPIPSNKNTRRRISYMKEEDSIKLVSKHLFNDSGQHPSIVGGECFDRILSEAKKK